MSEGAGPEGAEPEGSGATRVIVAILTLNEAARLPGCLAAVPADYPVVVIDSGSSDGTDEIARRAGARVLDNPWPGFAAQRNFCLDACRDLADWVLFIDADEVFPPAFFNWLAAATAAGDPGFDVAQIPSHLVFCGRTLRRAPGYPVYHPRLVRTRGVRFVPNGSGHGETVAEPFREGFCPVPYLHFFYDGDLTGWMRKHVGLAAQEAAAADTAGEGRLTARARLNRLFGCGLLRVPLRFFYHYVWRGGWRDGRAGLLYALMYAWFEATKWLLRLSASTHTAGRDDPS
jgi:glycosyltransferase involved in cell wall biosynthesis